MNKLTPCPFCQGEAKLEPDYDLFYVHCEVCGCVGADSRDKGKAVAQWNARPIEDALRGEVARLTAELKAAREAMRWIPVAERLPEEAQPVLVQFFNDVAIGKYYDDGDAIAWQVGKMWKMPVTHWMPLPAAPEPRE